MDGFQAGPNVRALRVESFDAPLARVDRRQHLDRDHARAHVQTEAGIDAPRNVDVEGHDRRPDVRRQMECTLVERAQLARRDPLALRRQVDRFAAALQGPSGVREDRAPALGRNQGS